MIIPEVECKSRADRKPKKNVLPKSFIGTTTLMFKPIRPRLPACSMRSRRLKTLTVCHGKNAQTCFSVSIVWMFATALCGTGQANCSLLKSCIKTAKRTFGELLTAAYMFFFMPIAALFPLMSMSYFNGTPVHASIAEIAFAGGMLAGGILLSIWGGFKNRILSIGLSILVMGVSIAVSGLLPSSAFPAFAVCCVAMGLTSPFYGVQNALIQERIAPEYLGRVFAMLSSVISFAMPMGLLCSGIFAEQIGVEKWFLLCGIGIIAVSMLVFVLPVLRDFDRKTKVSE